MAGVAVAPALGVIKEHFSTTPDILVTLIISIPALFIIITNIAFKSLCRFIRTRTIAGRASCFCVVAFEFFCVFLRINFYAVYDIYENKKGVLPIGCWAHARRKSEEALSEDKARASYALEQIGLFYQVERRADQENLSFDERAELRSRLAGLLSGQCPQV